MKLVALTFDLCYHATMTVKRVNLMANFAAERGLPIIQLADLVLDLGGLQQSR